MTDKPKTYVGLDLSGSQTRCMVAARNGPQLQFVACGTMPPIRWDGESPASSQMPLAAVQEAVYEVEQEGGLTVHGCVVGIGTAEVRSNLVHTAVALPHGRAVVQEDMANAVRKAAGGVLGASSTVLQLVPLEFVAGRHGAVQNPVGLEADRLEAYVRVISTHDVEHKTAQELVNQAGLRVEETVLGGFAAAYATLSDSELSNGVAHLQIGQTASTLTAYCNGGLRLAKGLPIGRDHMVGDVARACSTDMVTASSLISDFGSVRHSKPSGAYVVVPTTDPRYAGKPGRAWPRHMLDNILVMRVEECIQLAHDELHHEGLVNGAIRSLVITGDAAAMPGIGETARSVVGLRTRVGVPSCPDGMPDELRSPGWACSAGLVLYAHRLAYRPEDRQESEISMAQLREQEKAA